MDRFIDYAMVKKELNLSDEDVKNFTQRTWEQLESFALDNQIINKKEATALVLLEQNPQTFFNNLNKHKEIKTLYKCDIKHFDSYLIFAGYTSKHLLDLAFEEKEWGILGNEKVSSRFFRNYSYKKLNDLAEQQEYHLSYDFYINNYLDNNHIKEQLAYLYVLYFEKFKY